MDILLQTDFLDYYDYWFSEIERISWPERGVHIFSRYSRDTFSKREDFAILEMLGFDTPLHGLVRDIAPQMQITHTSNPHVVVYIDEYAHRGEGKEILSLWEALECFPENYCSVYMSRTGDKHRYEDIAPAAESIRYLYIGARCFQLLYQSAGWKSNENPLAIEFLREITDVTNDLTLADTFRLPAPIYAVDLVHDCDWMFYAIDLNRSPELKSTPIKDILPAKEVYNLIEEYYRRHED